MLVQRMVIDCFFHFNVFLHSAFFCILIFLITTIDWLAIEVLNGRVQDVFAKLMPICWAPILRIKLVHKTKIFEARNVALSTIKLDWIRLFQGRDLVLILLAIEVIIHARVRASFAQLS